MRSTSSRGTSTYTDSGTTAAVSTSALTTGSHIGTTAVSTVIPIAASGKIAIQVMTARVWMLASPGGR